MKYPKLGVLNKPLFPRLRFILLVCCAVVFVFSAIMLILDYVQGANEENAFKELAAVVAEVPSYTPNGISESSPARQTFDVLPQYQKLHEQNADMVGWIRIDDTGIDYPVMYTSDDFYLSHGFDKEAAKNGVPFIDKRCTAEPLGTNAIIYGHHMRNGTMFASLENYQDKSYYEAHPTIHFDTLYEEREYEIIAAFESQIYRQSDTVFKYYNFLNAKNEVDLDEYITNIKMLALYDTGVDASFGDRFLTLATCDYHTENGQFVVVAKSVDEN